MRDDVGTSSCTASLQSQRVISAACVPTLWPLSDNAEAKDAPRIRSHEEEEARSATIFAIICIYELSAPGVYQNCAKIGARRSRDPFLGIIVNRVGLFISIINARNFILACIHLGNAR